MIRGSRTSTFTEGNYPVERKSSEICEREGGRLMEGEPEEEVENRSGIWRRRQAPPGQEGGGIVGMFVGCGELARVAGDQVFCLKREENGGF